MKDGFLGYHTSFMLDAVVVALVLVIPVLLFSLFYVKFRQHYVRHRNLQLTLAVLLLLAVFAFEFDLHWIQKANQKIGLARSIYSWSRVNSPNSVSPAFGRTQFVSDPSFETKKRSTVLKDCALEYGLNLENNFSRKFVLSNLIGYSKTFDQ